MAEEEKVVPETEEVIKPAAEPDENDKLMAGACYLTQVLIPIILPLIVLLSEVSKKKPFQKYHAAQSLGFLVVVIIYEIAASVIYVLLTLVSAGCLGCILWLLFLLPVVPAIYYAYLAYQGQYFEIPILTDFMVQQGWLEKMA